MRERSSGNAVPIQAGASRTMRGAALHAFRFLASGTLALVVNAAILALLNRGFGFHQFLSRLVAISIATVVGWLAHRNITFLLQCPLPFASLSPAQQPALSPAQPNGGPLAD